MSLVNHFFFRTYALDLGVYTNALYDYCHGQWNDSLVFKEQPENLLADHVDLYLVIFSPLSFLLGSYTLLVIQIAALLMGGWGVYRLLRLDERTSRLAPFALIYFFCFYGVYGALGFDYHSNVVAACLVPWLWYWIAQKKWMHTVLILVLLVVSKENVSLWIAFVCFGLAVEYWSDTITRKFMLVSGVVCLFLFVLITSYLIPWLSNDGSYAHFDYSVLGSNMKEALIHLVWHPVDSLVVFFTNHVHHVNGDFVKPELLVVLMTSGIFF